MNAKVLINGLLGLFVLMMLVITSGATPAMAQGPTTPTPPRLAQNANKSPVLTHDVGHLARTEQLDVLLDQGAVPDPLALNYTLANWDKVLVTHENSSVDPRLYSHAFDTPENLNSLNWGPRIYAQQIMNGAQNFASASGHFIDRPGTAQSIVAYASRGWDGHEIILQTNDRFDFIKRESIAGTEVSAGEGAYGAMNVAGDPAGALVRVATGHLYGNQYDQIALAWEGGDQMLNIKTYTTNGGMTPVGQKKISDERLGGNKYLDLATGDFNKDGRDEIVVAWAGADGNLWFKILRVGNDGTLTTTARQAIGTNGDLGRIALATGDFNGDRIDEIAVAFTTTTSNTQATFLVLFQVTNDLRTITAKSTMPYVRGKLAGPLGLPLALGAGDLNSDGVDELVLVDFDHELIGNWYDIIRVLAADAKLALVAKATYTSATLYNSPGYDVAVAVGDLNRDTRAEIVLATTNKRNGEYPLYFADAYQVTTNLDRIDFKGTADNYYRNEYNRRIAVTVAPFDGKSVRVGTPNYKRISETKQIIAVVNAPPKHRDVIGSTTYDINVTNRCGSGPCTYARYETEQKTSTQMGLSTTRSWSVSAEAKTKFFFVEQSLKASYGESFEKTTTSFKTMAFGETALADKDDIMFRAEQNLDVWEYPVYGDTSDAIQGYIAVVFPVKIDSTCQSNCDGTVIARVDGKNPASRYLPNHEFGNVLSYSTQAPTDMDRNIKIGTLNYLGPNPYEFWVKWSDVEGSEEKKSSKLDLQTSLKVSGFGQSLGIQGSYSQGSLSTSKVSFETSTAIHLNYYGIEQQYSYGVLPYFYWAKPDGRLTLDYMVSTPSNTPPTWWQNTYTKTDPAFNLPWKDGSLGNDYKLLTKEITFDPPAPSAGQPVTVTAKIRNYSVIGVNNVPVRFYLGDPGSGGSQIFETTISQLDPMSAKSVAFQFDTNGRGGQTIKLYAMLDPNNTIQEMHKDNNKAYAILPIKRPGIRTLPAMLTLGPEDLSFTPAPPNSGQLTLLGATIHASGDDYANVGVEFWDGDPQRGGQMIGGDMIPLILKDSTGAVTLGWDTSGVRGTHDIWVVIQNQPDDNSTTGHRADKLLALSDTYMVAGRVTNEINSPIAGVTIFATPLISTTTNAFGDYAFTDLAAGTYNLTASKTGYTFQPTTRQVAVPPNASGQNFTGYTLRPPTSITASDDAYATHVLVTWGASPTATMYKVYRNTTNDPNSATLIATLNAVMRYEDTSAVRGVTYNYWVKAVNAQWESDFSTTDSGIRAANWQSETVNWPVNYGSNWTRIANITKPGATNIRVHFSQIGLGVGDRLSTSIGDNWTGALNDVWSRATVDRNSLSVALFSGANGSGSFVIDRIEFQGTSAGPATWAGDLTPGTPTRTPTIPMPPISTPTRTPTLQIPPSNSPTWTPTIVLPPTIPSGGQTQPTRTPTVVRTNTPVPSMVIQVNASTFAPNSLRVTRGTTVTWRNADTVAHTIVSGTPARRTNLFNPVILAPGQLFTFTFTTAGVYSYFDEKLGAQKQGTITVQ